MDECLGDAMPISMPLRMSRSMPITVYVLGLSGFCMGTTEIMVSGLLPALSADFGVPIPTAGLLISSFAAGIMIGSPLLGFALAGMERKRALAGQLAVFVAGHVFGALAPGFGVLLASRVICAMAMGGFLSIGTATAVRLAGTHARARALSLIVGGFTLANVLGLPAATLIEQHAHWRVSFAAVAGISALCLVAVIVLIPRQDATEQSGGRAELPALANPRLWVWLLASALFLAAVVCPFAYLSPLLTEVTGYAPGTVPVLQSVYGAGTIIGIVLGGRFADRHPVRTLGLGLAALMIALVVLGMTAADPAATVVTMFCFGVAALVPNPALSTMIMRTAGDGPLVASSVGVAFNVGIMAGPVAGGLAISSGRGYLGPVWIGLGFAVACGLVVLLGQLTPRRGPGADDEIHPRPRRAPRSRTFSRNSSTVHEENVCHASGRPA